MSTDEPGIAGSHRGLETFLVIEFASPLGLFLRVPEGERKHHSDFIAGAVIFSLIIN